MQAWSAPYRRCPSQSRIGRCPSSLVQGRAANAVLTFHPRPTTTAVRREIPNCRAIRDGVMPALTAARTVFASPRVKGTSVISTCCRFSGGDDCIFVKSGRAGKPVSTTCGVLPRRFIPSNVAACIKSNSPSLKCLTAVRRFLGRTYRGSLSGAACVAGNAEAVAVGTDLAPLARQGRVPWRQHASNSNGRQSTANVCANPPAFANGARNRFQCFTRSLFYRARFRGSCDLSDRVNATL